jgi:Flp pilus assembly protein protease CpaA
LSVHGVQVFENVTVQSGYWLQWGTLVGASLAAAITDVRQGRIPNRLTLPLWLLGSAKATYLGGAGGLLGALEVSVLLALPYIVLYLLAKGGAGDAKLMAAIGAWLSFDEGLIVLCCVATTGMVLALLRIAASRKRQSPLSGMLTSLYLCAAAWSSVVHGWGLLTHNEEGRTQEQTGRLSLPYGLAIFIGVCIGAVGVRLWIGQGS